MLDHLARRAVDPLDDVRPQVDAVPGQRAEDVLGQPAAPLDRPGGVSRGRGRLAEDILRALARHGIDLRPHVVERVDRTPREMVQHWGSSPHGVLWQGRSTVRHRLGPKTPVAGVYAAGAHATPGGGLPFVGLSAALVAQAVGPA